MENPINNNITNITNITFPACSIHSSGFGLCFFYFTFSWLLVLVWLIYLIYWCTVTRQTKEMVKTLLKSDSEREVILNQILVDRGLTNADINRLDTSSNLTTVMESFQLDILKLLQIYDYVPENIYHWEKIIHQYPNKFINFSQQCLTHAEMQYLIDNKISQQEHDKRYVGYNALGLLFFGGIIIMLFVSMSTIGTLVEGFGE